MKTEKPSIVEEPKEKHKERLARAQNDKKDADDLCDYKY
jgi:hypothetical protein